MRSATALLFVAAASQAISLSATAATTPNNALGRVSMSKIDKRKLIDVEHGLDEELKQKDRVFVLFYASWCPFSARFLPIFDKYSQEKTRRCLRVKIDDKASLMEKYSVEVVPTVILFENGAVAKRLDGVAGAGLNEEQLKALIDARKH